MILGKLCQETMRLESITRIIQPLVTRGPLNVDIEGIAYDSRQVRRNFLFVALRGRHEDGARYIEDAIRRGAVAIVSEDDRWTRRDIAHIHVPDARLAMAEIACAFYNNPSGRIEAFGVTGTNGKTTTAFMIRRILEAAGRQPGLIGTIRYEFGNRVIPASRTTPEAPDIQFMLDQMVRQGCRAAVLEVSSHALHQKRVWGVDFDVGIFTNLTRDHLDYHQDMRGYFLAKSQLFRGLGDLEKSASAVINIDDAWGMEIANTQGLRAELLTYGLHPGAMVRAEDIRYGDHATSFFFASPWGNVPVTLPLLGRYNVSNALAALSACCARGIAPADAAEALSALPPVPGRLELVPNDRGLRIFVDYAHTDDALGNVLATLRELGPRKIVCVFGCGGDRDREKRPLMGAIAARLADRVIVTSDNPRTENPEAIIDEVMEGAGTREHVERVTDREQAIARALALAKPGDFVLVAGKGHENYQDFGSTVVPFDDREVVRRHLRG
jgi:UDP-N-acetylmuramoyl-L-alanyl-D-glutamate--2,6-diaminopimelate ligase